MKWLGRPHCRAKLPSIILTSAAARLSTVVFGRTQGTGMFVPTSTAWTATWAIKGGAVSFAELVTPHALLVLLELRTVWTLTIREGVVAGAAVHASDVPPSLKRFLAALCWAVLTWERYLSRLLAFPWRTRWEISFFIFFTSIIIICDCKTSIIIIMYID